jgi:hypothetical protein
MLPLLEQKMSRQAGSTPSGRLEVGKEWSAIRNALEVVQAEPDANRMRHSNEVQNGVGAAPSCNHHGHGIFECLPRHDLRGQNVLPHELPHVAAGHSAQQRPLPTWAPNLTGGPGYKQCE